MSDDEDADANEQAFAELRENLSTYEKKAVVFGQTPMPITTDKLGEFVDRLDDLKLALAQLNNARPADKHLIGLETVANAARALLTTTSRLLHSACLQIRRRALTWSP